jgi:hypothetical protein
MYLRSMYLSTVSLGSGARTNGKRKTCGAMSRIDGDTTKKVTWLRVPHIRTHTRMPACMVRFRVGTRPGVWSHDARARRLSIPVFCGACYTRIFRVGRGS